MKQIHSFFRIYLSDEIRCFDCLIEKFLKLFTVLKNLPILVPEVENFTETAELVLAHSFPEVFLLFDFLSFHLESLSIHFTFS